MPRVVELATALPDDAPASPLGTRMRERVCGDARHPGRTISHGHRWRPVPAIGWPSVPHRGPVPAACLPRPAGTSRPRWVGRLGRAAGTSATQDRATSGRRGRVRVQQLGRPARACGARRTNPGGWSTGVPLVPDACRAVRTLVRRRQRGRWPRGARTPMRAGDRPDADGARERAHWSCCQASVVDDSRFRLLHQSCSTRKGRALRANPRASVVFPWRRADAPRTGGRCAGRPGHHRGLGRDECPRLLRVEAAMARGSGASGASATTRPTVIAYVATVLKARYPPSWRPSFPARSPAATPTPAIVPDAWATRFVVRSGWH